MQKREGYACHKYVEICHVVGDARRLGLDIRDLLGDVGQLCLAYLGMDS